MDPCQHTTYGQIPCLNTTFCASDLEELRQAARALYYDPSGQLSPHYPQVSTSPSSSGCSGNFATPSTDTTQFAPSEQEWQSQLDFHQDRTEPFLSGPAERDTVVGEIYGPLPPPEDEDLFHGFPAHEVAVNAFRSESYTHHVSMQDLWLSVGARAPAIEQSHAAALWENSDKTHSHFADSVMRDSCISDQTAVPFTSSGLPEDGYNCAPTNSFGRNDKAWVSKNRDIPPLFIPSVGDEQSCHRRYEESYNTNHADYLSDDSDGMSSWASLSSPSGTDAVRSVSQSPLSSIPQNKYINGIREPIREENIIVIGSLPRNPASEGTLRFLRNAVSGSLQNTATVPSIAVRENTPPLCIPPRSCVQNNPNLLYVPVQSYASRRCGLGRRLDHATSGHKLARQRRSKPKGVKHDTKPPRPACACIRCRFQKAPCAKDPNDPDGPCLTCKEIKGLTAANLGCMRYKVTDARLYRLQDMPYQIFSRRWQSMDLVDITEWASPQIKTIEITQVFLDAPLKLEVREFVPKRGDMLVEQWQDGLTTHYHRIPAYAMTDLRSKKMIYDEFIDKNIGNYLNGVIAHRQLGELFFITYAECMRHALRKQDTNEHQLLINALKLWVSCRMTSHPHHIVGHEDLGGTPIHDSKSPQDGRNPMPPIMIAQQELIMYTHFLRPLSHAVLKELQALIYANKREFWYTIYLVMFLVLHSCSMITTRNEEYARQLNLETRYKDALAIEQHHGGAQIILAHFHYINKGDKPFSDALDEKKYHYFVDEVSLIPEQAVFIKKTALCVQGMEQDLKRARSSRDYGDDLYWIAQLYDPNWRPHVFAE